MRRQRQYLVLLLIFMSSAAPARAQTKADAIDDLVAKYHEYDMFNGAVLVAESGEVLYEKAVGLANAEWNVPNSLDTKFRIGSVTKQFTAALILQLVEEGKIDLEDPITAYLPDYPAKHGDRVTIHQLLTHTSGIPSYTSMPEMEVFSRTAYEPDSFLTNFWDRDLQFEPGAEWSYNNSGYFILGVIVEKLTGQDYDDALRTRILDPAGLHDTGYDRFEEVIDKRASGYTRFGGRLERASFLDSSVPYSAGMMYSTVRDLYKWDQSLYAGALFDKDETAALWFGPHVDVPGEASGGYGYGWFTRTVQLGDTEVEVVEHGGGIPGFITGFWRIPADGHTIIAMDNTSSQQVGDLVHGIAAILYGEPAPEPKRPIADVISGVIETEGIEAATRRYRELKAKSSEGYDFGEMQLNMLGYGYLRSGDVRTAIEIFKLNVEAFPEAYNVYDSLGEAYMAADDDDRAIANYRKALELNPGFDNARQMLKKLGVEVEEQTVQLSDALLDEYVGSYAIQPNFVLSITREGEQMFVQATGQPRAEIYPSSETKFYLKVVDAQLTFERNEDGAVHRVVLHQNGQDMPATRTD